MSSSIAKKKWMRWYPRKILLKNEKDSRKILCHLDKFTEKDFLVDIKKTQPCNIVINDSELKKIDIKKTEAYKLGFKEGFLKGKEDNTLLESKLHKLCLDFENSLTIFENLLFSRLLKTVLKISSYVLDKKIDFNESCLIKYIKKVINQDGIFLKKPRLVIHPSNRILIEKTFKDFFNTYQWTLVYDTSMDLNSCKVKSESGDVDVTIDARWQELCRLIYSEEY